MGRYQKTGKASRLSGTGPHQTSRDFRMWNAKRPVFTMPGTVRRKHRLKSRGATWLEPGWKPPSADTAQTKENRKPGRWFDTIAATFMAEKSILDHDRTGASRGAEKNGRSLQLILEATGTAAPTSSLVARQGVVAH